MKLYDNPLSPYAMKVRMILYEKGIEFEKHEVYTHAQADELRRLNPRAEVPALVDRGVTEHQQVGDHASQAEDAFRHQRCAQHRDGHDAHQAQDAHCTPENGPMRFGGGGHPQENRCGRRDAPNDAPPGKRQARQVVDRRRQRPDAGDAHG